MDLPVRPVKHGGIKNCSLVYFLAVYIILKQRQSTKNFSRRADYFDSPLWFTYHYIKKNELLTSPPIMLGELGPIFKNAVLM